MNRRDLFKRLVGAGAAIAVAPSAETSSIDGKILTMDQARATLEMPRLSREFAEAFSDALRADQHGLRSRIQAIVR